MRTRSGVLKSRTFRLVLIYTGLFSIALVVVLGSLYSTTSSSVTRQIDATIDAEITGLAEQYYQRGTNGLIEAIDRRTAGNQDRGATYFLAGPDFRRLAGNLTAWPNVQPDSDGWVTFPFRFSPPNDKGVRQGRAKTFRLGGRLYLLVGHDIRERQQVAAQIEEALIWGLAAMMVLTLLAAVVVSTALLRRIDTINNTSREIMAGDLGQRIPVSGGTDEFDQLAGNLNAMLDQNETLLFGMKQVTDNIAHDLRSPLGRLRTRLEGLLSGSSTKGETRSEIEQAIAEVDDLLKTFNALLSIAQIEAGAARQHFESIDLTEIVQDVTELYQPLAEDKGITLILAASTGPAPIRGERNLLSQALANLTDNAIKYTPKGGQIDLGLRRDGARLIVTVRDNGPGIPSAARGKVLGRFYRLETSRSTPGSGLGLSLAAAVAKLHGGALTLSDNKPGLVATLALPSESRTRLEDSDSRARRNARKSRVSAAAKS